MCTCGKLLTLSPFFFFVPKPHFNTWQIYSGGCCVFISGTDTECTYCKSLLCPYFSTLCTLRIKWRGGHLLTSVEPPVYVLNTELRPPGISRTTSLHFPAEARCSTTWRVSEISETLSMVFFLRIFWSTPTEFWQYVLRDWSIQYVSLVQDCGCSVVRAQAAQARDPGFNSWWLPALHFPNKQPSLHFLHTCKQRVTPDPCVYFLSSYLMLHDNTMPMWWISIFAYWKWSNTGGGEA